jgi:hypothetical protein
MPLFNPTENLSEPNENVSNTVPEAHSGYNSLQIALNRQMTNNIQGQVSYTWSKCLDSGSVTSGQENQTASEAGGAISPYNLSLERGLCNYNVPQSLRVNSLIQLPFHGNKAVRGWSFSQILSATAGYPLNIVDGFDQDGLGIFADNPPDYKNGVKCNRVTGNPMQWFDPTCYTLGPLGQIGDVRRNSVSGPGILDLDIALHKETRITEKLDTQFRAEFFNVINHPNFGEPNSMAVFSGSFGQNPSSPVTYNPTAGQITSTSTSSRQIQFALKFIF